MRFIHGLTKYCQLALLCAIAAPMLGAYAYSVEEDPTPWLTSTAILSPVFAIVSLFSLGHVLRNTCVASDRTWLEMIQLAVHISCLLVLPIALAAFTSINITATILWVLCIFWTLVFIYFNWQFLQKEDVIQRREFDVLIDARYQENPEFDIAATVKHL